MTQAGLIGIVGIPLIVAAAAASAALIVLLKPILARYAMARPNARSSHREPTPQGGGIAVVIATLAVAMAFLFGISTRGGELLILVAPVFTAAALLAVLGAFDDIRALSVGTRLLLHTLATAAVIMTLPDELRVVPALPLLAERGLLIIGGVWFINLVNFMDGIDWMTVAEVLPLTAGLAITGLFEALPPYGTVVALALFGATLGFAPFNRPVARLFLGDVGSLPIGLLSGWLLALLATRGHLAAAVILPLYYLADATVTLIRRILNGERVWHAHRSHFYQRATDHGFTVSEVVARVFVVNLVLVALAITTIVYASTLVTIGALVIAAVVVALLLMNFNRRRNIIAG